MLGVWFVHGHGEIKMTFVPAGCEHGTRAVHGGVSVRGTGEG